MRTRSLFFPLLIMAMLATAALLSGQTPRPATNAAPTSWADRLQGPAAPSPDVATAQTLPRGTVLPVELETTLDSRSAKAGTPVVATVMQDIPLEGKRVMRAGSKLLGIITQVRRDSDQAAIGVRFDRLRVQRSNAQLAVDTRLRAVASPMAVTNAQITTTFGLGWNNPRADWTTVQIGGDVVYRGGGPVVNPYGEIVGHPIQGGVVGGGILGYGVLAEVKNASDSACQGLPVRTGPQALWLFSSAACGVYDFYGMQYQNLGGGEILFTAPKRVNIRGGSALLLDATGTQPASTISVGGRSKAS